MIIQNGGIDAVEKWIENETKRSEQLKALITTDNKETIVKVLEIVYDRVMDCEGELVNDNRERVANVIDGQDASGVICYTIEEIKAAEMKELNYKEMWNKLKKRIEVGYNETKELSPEWNLIQSLGAPIINADCKRWLNVMSFLEKGNWECEMCHKHIEDGEVNIYCKDCQQKIKTGAFDE